MRKRTAAIAAVAVLAVGGGVAYAVWSSSGDGSGRATSTKELNSTITPLAGDGLWPGHTVSFTVEIDNPNPYAVRVTSISGGTAPSPVSGCADGTVTSAAATNPGGVIEPGHTATYTLQATMKAEATDACKLQTFTLPMTAQLVQVAS